MQDVVETWNIALSEIKKEVNLGGFEKWFGDILTVRQNEENIEIFLKSAFSAHYMENNFGPLIKKHLSAVCGLDVPVVFLSAADKTLPGKPKPAPKTETSSGRDFVFNPRYTFSSFVVGANNRFAHAAAMAVADRLAGAYNPLFIYGGSGLGKTHLIHAVGQQALKKNPALKVVYVSTEGFTNDFISYVKTGKAFAFKNRYRSADIFLIDDIQFLAGKESTQEEFFHTFNALHEAGKQIVISSDRSPKELLTLEERLRSRFEWGLIIDIQPPDLETRIAILQRKMASSRTKADDEVIYYIAGKIKSNIRELEGALNKVVYVAETSAIKNITIADAREALRGILPEDKKPPLTIETVQKAVASYFDISVSDLKSPKRSRSIAWPRQIGMYLCREMTDFPFDRIGNEFGGKDHSTVMYACEKISSLLKNPVREEEERLSGAILSLREIIENR